MVKVPLKWFSLLLCAGVMITSSDLQAQRKKTTKASSSAKATQASPKAMPGTAADRAQKKNDSKKEADEKKPEEEELVVEEITDEQFDTDEEAEGEGESKEEAEKEEEAPAQETEKKEAAPEEKAEEPEEKAEKKPAGPAVIGSPDAAPEEEKPADVSDEEKTEEVAEEPAEEVADVSEEAPAKTEEPAAEPGEAPGEEPPTEEVAEGEEAPADEPEPKEELGPDEIMGIDTVDLEDPQGNWLYKRVWWERAEAKYEKIRAAVTSVLEIRTKFFAKRAELDKNTLDPFYIKTGFSQGELKERLAERIAQLEKDIEDKSDVQHLEKLEANKLTLEDLQKEVATVVKQDEEVENAILMLVEQANKMRNYEQQAWQDFKNIARVLDDKKARELFYKVDGAWRNIQELKQYVESNFSTGFDQLVQRVVQQVQKVDAAMQLLKEKGIELKRAEEDADEDEAEEPPRGIISRFIITPISTVFRAIWDVIMWPIRKIMGTTTPAEEEPVSTKAPSGKPVGEEVVQEEITEEVAVEEPKQVDKKEPVSAYPGLPARQATPDKPVSVGLPETERPTPSGEPISGEPESTEPTPSSTPSVTVPPSIAAPPAVPEPEPAGTPLAEGDVAPEKPDKVEAETPAPEDEAVAGDQDAVPADEEAAAGEEVKEETIEVDEGEPMMDDLDTSLEIEEE